MFLIKKSTIRRSAKSFLRPILHVFYILIATLSYGQRSAESIAKGETLPSAGVSLFSPSITENNCIEISLHHENLYCTKELNSAYIESRFPFHPLPICIQFNFGGYRHYRRYTLSTSTSQKLSNRLSIGCILNYTFYNYTGKSSPEFSIGTHVDCLWQLSEQHKLYGKIFHQFLTKESINTEKNWISFGYELCLNNIEWITELNLWDYEKLKYHMGFEYEFASFMIRLGAKGLPMTPSYGLGYEKKQWKGSVSASWLPALGHSFSIDICYHLIFNKS